MIGSITFIYPFLAPLRLANASETPYSIWNTTAGSDSTPSPSGLSVFPLLPSNGASNLFDRNTATKYSNDGFCALLGGLVFPDCGSSLGLFLTLARGRSLLVAFRMATTTGSASFDPLEVTIEGSNGPSFLLNRGSSWSLIYNGTTGLESDPGRARFGLTQWLTTNERIFSSYRILITSKRGSGYTVEFSELELLGY